VVAKPGSPHGSGLGVFRWVVERTLAWLHRFRHLALRYERRADVHEAFLGGSHASDARRRAHSHSAKRRQHVLPEPHPISRGNICAPIISEGPTVL
jgi:hypothetical protein